MTPDVLRAGQDFYDSQLFGSSFIFEPLHYGFGNSSQPMETLIIEKGARFDLQQLKAQAV
jgi:hypothetical protein